MSRKLFLLLGVFLMLMTSPVYAQEEDDEYTICTELIFTQIEVTGETEEVVFAWTPHDDAAAYRLEIQSVDGRVMYTYRTTRQGYAVSVADLISPDPRLRTNEFAYQLIVLDAAGNSICRSGFGFLSLDPAVIEDDCPRIVVVLEGSPYTGPRDLDVSGDNFDGGEIELGDACGLEIHGNDNDNSLYAGPGDDVIFAYDGMDEVDGRGGNDLIFGDAGDDVHLYGNMGDDTIYCGEGRDEGDGGLGRDTIYGGPGDELWLFGAEDDDVLYGEAGQDELDGGSGNDLLYGGEGDDTWLYGGDGDDTIDGGPGCDEADGGEGEDTLLNICEDVERIETVEATGGGETVEEAEDEEISDEMAYIAAQWGRCPGNMIFERVEFVYAADQTVTEIVFDWTSHPAADRYSLQIAPVGGGEMQEYSGELSQRVPVIDLAAGATGEETESLSFDLNGYVYQLVAIDSEGDSICNTGYGYFNLNPDALIEPDPTCNRVIVVMADSPYTGPRDTDVPDSTYYGADYIELGVMCGVIIHANANDNEISATSARDIIYGYGGNDTWLYGDAGDDIIFGGEGDDEIDGGEGNDIIFGGPGNELWLYGSEGDDIIFGEDGEDELDGGPGNDSLYGGPGNDPWLYGAEGDDIIAGGPGCNEIGGGPGDNTITGAVSCEVDVAGEDSGAEEEVACDEIFKFNHVEVRYQDGNASAVSFEWTTLDVDWYRLLVVSPTGAVKEILLLGDLGILLPVGELAGPDGQISPGQYAAVVVAQEEGVGAVFTDVCRTKPAYFTIDSVSGGQ